jgi:hypothetical protein
MSNSFQLVASTVLFVDSHPIGYKIYKADDDFMLRPSDIPDDSIQPPLLTAHQSPDCWTVSGTADQDLIDQVIEDISGIGHIAPKKKAAPLRTALT